MMERSHALVSDIDGTLLVEGESTLGIRALEHMIDRHDEVALVYATGRTFRSVASLVWQGTLPTPQAVIALVGSEIWLPPWKEPDTAWSRHLDEGWDREQVIRLAREFPRLEMQPERHQGPYKASWFVGSEEDFRGLDERLADAGIRARIIHSKGRFLDVLPANAGKRRAALWLQERWGVEQVMAAGDSGNDHDMLSEPGFDGVVVGNASSRTMRIAERRDDVYSSTLPYAAGVLEGAEATGFWPDST